MKSTDMLSDQGRNKDAPPAGETVPGLKLVDQNQQRVSHSDFAGKVAAVTFV